MLAAPSWPLARRCCALALALLVAPSLALAQPLPPVAPPPGLGAPGLDAPPPGAAAPLPLVAPPPPPPPAAPPPAGPEPLPAIAVLPGSTAIEQEAPAPEAVAPRPPDLRASAPYFPINLAFLHPLSSNAAIPDLRTNFALGVMLDRVGYIDGLQLAAVSSVTHDLHGVQLGAADLVDGTADGLQLGGVFAFSDGPLRGAQIAGMLGWAASSFTGFQLAGLINRSTGVGQGAQIAGLSNWSNDSYSGLQLAGGINQSKGEVRGVQIAGALNAAYGNLEGVQIGTFNIGKVRGLQLGLINVSADTRGTQIGLINVARRSDGLQVGLVNITDNLQGESLGIASLPREGGIHLAVWGSNSLSGNLGVKFASKVVYSILSTVLHREEKRNVYGGGVTLGVHFPIFTDLLEGLQISADLGGYRLARDPGPSTRHDEVYKARVLLSYEVARHFSFFAGGGAHFAVRGDDQLTTSMGPEICGGLEL